MAPKTKTRFPRPCRLAGLCVVAVLLSGTNLLGDADQKTASKDPAATARIEGVYEADGVKLTVEWANQTPRGEYVRGGKSYKFVGKKVSEGIAGVLQNGEVKIEFTAKMDGDRLAFTAGFDTVKLKRVKSSTSAVQGNVKIRETVLAKSKDALGSSVRVSSDNTKVVFATQSKNSLLVRLWINGKLQQTEYDGSGVRFSDNAQRLAYRLIKDSKSYFVVDDKRQGPYDEVKVHPGAFSSDSKRTIYAARTGDTWRVVVEGKPGPAFDEILPSFGFSPDGQRWAYVGRRGAQWHAVVMDQVSPGYEAIVTRGITFSPDGKRAYYAIGRDGKQVAILDGKELGTYDAVAEAEFSPRGDRFAYVVFEGSSRKVIVDGKADPSFAHVSQLRFSEDGKRFAYTARADGMWKLVVDGELRDGGYQKISTPVFGSSGESIIYLGGLKGKQYVVLNGKPSTAYDQVDGATFSPDGKRLGYVARTGTKWVVVVDGKSSYPYNSKPGFPWFGPDSKHVVYSATRQGNTYLVVDGTEGKAVWPMLRGSSIVFDEANRFRTVVRRKDEFIRLDVDIVK